MRFALLFALPAVALAQTVLPPVTVSRPVTLAEVLAGARDGNKDLVVLRESVPQAQAQRDQAYAFIQPSLDATVNLRVNDREIAFDPAESFGDTSSLTDAFVPLYENIGFIYGKMFENGDISITGDDCDQIAEINGFADCAALTDAFINGDGFEVDDGGDSAAMEPLIVQPLAQLNFIAQFQWPLSPRVIPMASAGARNIEAAEGQLAAATEQLYAGVVQTYGFAYQAQEGARLLEGQVELAAAHVGETEALLATGMITADQVLRARVEKARLELQLFEARNQEGQARRALATLMGRVEEPSGELAPLPDVDLGPMPDARELAEAAQKRPDLRAAEAQALAAKNLAIDGILQFLPQAAITGQFMASPQNAGFDDRKYNFNVNFNLIVPIWDGGVRLNNARITSSQKRQAVANVDRLRLSVLQEVRDAWAAYDAAKASLPLARMERDLAKEAYRLTEVRYGAGAARQIEVLDARSALQASELSSLQAEVNTSLSAAALLASAGKLRAWVRELAP